MSAHRWMQKWQTRFASLGVELVVADVGQSSLFLDLAERKVVLAPSLEVDQAEKMLAAVHEWWERQPEQARLACAVVALRDSYLKTGIVGPHTEIPHDKPFPEPAMPDTHSL